MAMEASEKIYECRQNLAVLFGINDPLRIVFTINATEAINLALKGLLMPGDHVIFSSMEHNSVVRPLKKLQAKGVEITAARANCHGVVTAAEYARHIKPNTRLLIAAHASNVTGTINDMAALGQLAQAHDLFFMVDAAQTAGSYPLDTELMNIDFLAFSGHKGLMGPQGTGGLYIREGIVLDTLKEGGTGSISESLQQPDFLPDRHESGTLNTPGIAGLNAGIKYILEIGVDNIRAHEKKLTAHMLQGLQEIKNVKVYGTQDIDSRTGVVSINIAGWDCNEAAHELDKKYGIAVRGGMHCAYLAHETMGTESTGTIRFSIGFFNTIRDIDRALQAIKIMADLKP